MAFLGIVGVGGPESYTDVCGIYSPSRHSPPLKPNRKEKQPETSQYHCPRCGSSCSHPSNLKRHFPACIKTNGNPKSLRWFDGVSNNTADTQEQNPLKATVSTSKSAPSGFGLASSLEDEPSARKAMSKVDRWAAMAKKQAGTGSSPSNSMQLVGSPKLHNPTATGLTTDKSSPSDTPVVKRPALRLIVKPKPRVRFATPPPRDQPITPISVPITPISVQQQPRPRERRKCRIGHTENTAHLFNGAGFLIPSIPGIDPVTERLFDKGEIMSLRPSRSNDGYYPDGEPVGGSFLMENSNAKKRKRNDEN